MNLIKTTFNQLAVFKIKATSHITNFSAKAATLNKTLSIFLRKKMLRVAALATNVNTSEGLINHVH